MPKPSCFRRSASPWSAVRRPPRASMSAEAFIEEDSPVHSVDPEFFMFATQINPSDYMKGVLRVAQAIYEDLGGEA